MSVLDNQFRPPELADRDWVYPALRYSGRDSAEFTFGNIYTWSPSYRVAIAKIDGMLVIRSQHSYTIPAGDGDAGRVLREMLQETEEPLHLHGIDEVQKAWLEETFPGVFEMKDNRNEANYIYETEALAQLPGKKYHGKRNHCSFFEKNYNWSYEDITEDNLEEAYTFLKSWMEASPEKTKNESQAIDRSFQNFFALGFVGGLLRVDGKIIAVTAGEPINDQVFCTHIEKADGAYRGAYPMINREFARHALSGYEYVNREEDMGIPGLRKAKESYHPVALSASYLAVQKNSIDFSPWIATEKDRESMVALWQLVFRDDPSFVQNFLRFLEPPEHAVIIRDDKQVISMAHLIPCRYETEEDAFSAYYLYAAATHPDYRGRGYMATLLSFAKQLAAKRGTDLIFLVPAESGLYSYYEQFGYQPALYRRTLSLSRSAFLRALPEWKEESSFRSGLNRREQREQALRKTAHLSYTEKQLQYFFFLQAASGEKVSFAENGYAVYDRHEAELKMKELIYVGSPYPLLMSLLEEEAETYTFSLPAHSFFPEQSLREEPIGMAVAATERGEAALKEIDYPYIGFTLE